MSDRPAFFELLCQQAGQLHARILSRDDMQLKPALISKAAARRLKAGLRALEAYLRRVLLLMALEMEPDLAAQNRASPIYLAASRSTRGRPGLILFRQTRDMDRRPGPANCRDLPPNGQQLLPAAPLLARLAALRALIEAPWPRARRLAWTLARRRAGLVPAPGRGPGDVPARFGTQVSALYRAMGPAILAASRARPPPLGPKPRPPPRIRAI